jgi:hypothetical protein
LRDLLGLVRSIYRAWHRDGRTPIDTEILREVGEELKEALRLGRISAPGSAVHAAAWVKAERAMKQLGDLITIMETIKPVVESNRDRLCGRQQPTRDDPKLLKRRMRG